MSIKKPALEVINPSFGSSFSFIKFKENQNQNTSYWHYHPEIELVYVKGGAGKRQIGSHISYYTEGDLILIGSNLPHCGFTDKFTGNENEVVTQKLLDILNTEIMNIQELPNIQLLFKRCRGTLQLIAKTKDVIGEKIEPLERINNFQRLLGFLTILKELQHTQHYQILNAEA